MDKKKSCDLTHTIWNTTKVFKNNVLICGYRAHRIEVLLSSFVLKFNISLGKSDKKKYTIYSNQTDQKSNVAYIKKLCEEVNGQQQQSFS